MQNILIDKLKPMNNKVLVEIVGKFDDTVTFLGDKLKLNTSYNPEQYLTTSGIVRAIPDKLTFGTMPGDMEWITSIDIQCNDRVIMSYMGTASAMGADKRFIEENGKLYTFVHYSHLIMRVRGGVEKMLNGFNLVAPIKEIEEPGYKHIGIIPDHMKAKLSKSYGKVILLGEPNKRYVTDIHFDNTEIKCGDVVVYHKAAGIPFYRSTDDLIKGKPHLKIQSRYMLAVIN